ncbi:two component transcriptional regulator, LytTR family [Nannocystis exedens]|uniref:Two component transcriptional regulator, LytTR family n=1 Tax=Nannocystis exedens TaxID=54 RepID=A0A1I2ERZ1_9BACT|nr:LytTR family DNA-binding domain-containing protein [Nannocystis exedens]PCC73872.1 DNA-binding response regulator [Nannocystis exedens]SFE94990.1 two component transcriptional regulator, LytTR family [Nannocystis exedens]
MTALRVIIADDEPLARSRLRALLADHADIEVAAEAEDADAALQAIRGERPDLVLLDIEMPGIDGVALARRLHLTPAPLIVFVTAYADHAVDAFETGAIDYLLKPFDEARLATALNRVRTALAARRALAGEAAPTYLERVAVTLGKRTIFVATASIDWLAASANYVELHVGPEVHLLRTTLSALEAQLDPRVFVRIHRSYAVRLDAVKELRSVGAGEYRLLLTGGVELPVSQRYRDRLP